MGLEVILTRAHLLSKRLAARWVVKLNVAWSVWFVPVGFENEWLGFCELEKRFCRRRVPEVFCWMIFSSTLVLAYKMIMHISQVQQHLKGGLVYISLCLTKGVDQLSTFLPFFFFGIPSCHQVMFGSFEPAVAAPPKSKWFRSRGAAYRSRAAAVETFPGWFGTRFLLGIQKPLVFSDNCKFRVQIQVFKTCMEVGGMTEKRWYSNWSFPKVELQGVLWSLGLLLKPAVKPRFIGSKCLPGKTWWQALQQRMICRITRWHYRRAVFK